MSISEIDMVLSQFNIEYIENEITEKKETNDIYCSKIYTKIFFNNSKLFYIIIYDMKGINDTKYYGMNMQHPIRKFVHPKSKSIRLLFETLK